MPEGTKPLTGPLLPQMCRHMAWSGHNELLINSYDRPVILFGLCDLEVGLMTLEYHRAPLIFSSKLCASFRIERRGDHLCRTVDRSLPRLMGALLRAWLHLRHGAFWGCAPAPLTKLDLIDWFIAIFEYDSSSGYAQISAKYITEYMKFSSKMCNRISCTK